MGIHVIPKGASEGIDMEEPEALQFVTVAKAVSDTSDGGQILVSGDVWDLVDLQLVSK